MGGLPECAPDVVAPWLLNVQFLYRAAPEICAAIRPLRRTIRRCLDTGLKDNALGGDFVVLYLSVGESGRVESLVVDNGSRERASSADAGLEACLRGAMHRLRLGRGEADDDSIDMDLALPD